MSRVRTDFSAGKRFSRIATEAIADGITAATAKAQGLSALGMRASGSIQGVTPEREGSSGIQYYPGPGAPVGEYPKMRSGNLQRSTGFERARAFKGGRVVGYLTNSASYASYVHGTESRPLRPFLTLPFRRNRTDIMRTFVRATKRRLS